MVSVLYNDSIIVFYVMRQTKLDLSYIYSEDVLYYYQLLCKFVFDIIERFANIYIYKVPHI